jgi:4,5-DOPA dioxygenase extradiol
MQDLKSLKNFSSSLQNNGILMPALFIGHGSPMNGILNNEFSRQWNELATRIPQPSAIIIVSAHWLTRGTMITAMENPRTIHDFGGFPPELYKVEYNAPGDPALAKDTADLLKSFQITLDHDWGLDHGAWTIARHMYPDAKIPILQLSIDLTKDSRYHYELASELSALRKKGVLIIGSGNMVHNLGMVDWQRLNDDEYAFDWAAEMNSTFKDLILHGEHDKLVDYHKLGKGAMLAIPTPEHYLPLIYTLGLKDSKDDIEFFNDKAVGGSLTMTSVKFG